MGNCAGARFGGRYERLVLGKGLRWREFCCWTTTALCADNIEVQTRAAPSAPARGSAGVPAGANDRLLTVPPNPLPLLHAC